MANSQFTRQGWDQIRISICKYTYKYKYGYLYLYFMKFENVYLVALCYVLWFLVAACVWFYPHYFRDMHQPFEWPSGC